MAWVQLGVAALGVANAAVSKPLAPTGASSGGIDSSGWNVNFGSGDIDSSVAGLPGSAAYVQKASGGEVDNSGWNVNFGSGGISSKVAQQEAVSWLMIGGALIGLALLVRAWQKR